MKLAPSLPRGKLRPTGASVHEQCVRDRALTCPQIRPCLRLPARARVKSSTRHPSPHKSSGRKSNRRGVRTRRRCSSRRCRPKSRRRGPPAGILTWPGPGPTFHTADGSAQLQKAQAQCAAWGVPLGGPMRARAWVRRFSLGEICGEICGVGPEVGAGALNAHFGPLKAETGVRFP